MSKIPRDIMATAEALFPGSQWNPKRVEEVARAILAERMAERARCEAEFEADLLANRANAADFARFLERERCAKVAQEAVGAICRGDGPNFVLVGPAGIGMAIVAAMRNGAKPD